MAALQLNLLDTKGLSTQEQFYKFNTLFIILVLHPHGNVTLGAQKWHFLKTFQGENSCCYCVDSQNATFENDDVTASFLN